MVRGVQMWRKGKLDGKGVAGRGWVGGGRGG